MLLWSFFTVMPGMLVLISPSKRFWGQVHGFSLSHNSGLSIRMSVCLFWCCSSFFVWAYSWWGPEDCCAMDGLAASSSFHHGWEALPVFCSQEAQLLLFFPSLQLEYFSWLRRLFLDQYFEHGPVCWCVSWLLVPIHWLHILMLVWLLSVFLLVFSAGLISWFLLLPFHRFVDSMTDVGPVLLLEKLVFLLGVVFYLQASEWSFPWELLERKLSLGSLFCWSKDPNHLSTAVFLWQLLESCRLQM